MNCEQLGRLTLYLLSAASAIVILYAVGDKVAQVWRNRAGYLRLIGLDDQNPWRQTSMAVGRRVQQ